jgi:hypothetical protein
MPAGEVSMSEAAITVEDDEGDAPIIVPRRHFEVMFNAIQFAGKMIEVVDNVDAISNNAIRGLLRDLNLYERRAVSDPLAEVQAAMSADAPEEDDESADEDQPEEALA